MLISLKTLCMSPQTVLNELVRAVETNKLNPETTFVNIELKTANPLLVKEEQE